MPEIQKLITKNENEFITVVVFTKNYQIWRETKLAMTSSRCSSDQMDVVLVGILIIASYLLGGMTESTTARFFECVHEST